jgi:hypothetical protein
MYGSALLLTAELASWSLDERVGQRVQPRVVTPRLLASSPSPPPRSQRAPSYSSQPKLTWRDHRRQLDARELARNRL